MGLTQTSTVCPVDATRLGHRTEIDPLCKCLIPINQLWLQGALRAALSPVSQTNAYLERIVHAVHRLIV